MPDENGDISVAVLSSAGGGGGGIAARRVANAVNELDGFSARFVSRDMLGGVLPGEVSPLETLSNGKASDTHFTLENPGFKRQWVIDFLMQFDVINVHWASFMISLAEFDALARAGKAMLFTLHDFHYTTGGCHYPAGCQKMRSGCLNCPQVDETRCDPNVIRTNLRIKQSLFARPNVHLSAPSQYLRDQSVASGIVPPERAHVLRNPYFPVETERSYPNDHITRIVLIADSLHEGRKAMPLALDTLNALAERLAVEAPGLETMTNIIGYAPDELRQALSTCKLPFQLRGRITEHPHLANFLAISDVLLTCSYEDNWPNILVESGAYGCMPVVGPGHGCEEFAQTYNVGRITPDYNVDSFVDAMIDILLNKPDPAARDDFAQRVRADHESGRVGAGFADVFQRILSAGKDHAMPSARSSTYIAAE